MADTTELPNPTRDRQTIDALAALLGTSTNWDADLWEPIADLIGRVRPHPGNCPAESYRRRFEAMTGRQMPAQYDRTNL